MSVTAKAPGPNAAFIDSQNVNLGVQSLGWKLDWKRFRVYLADKYGVGRAYLFIGYIPKYQALYMSLQQAGFILVQKPVLPIKAGAPKGNVDADLVLHSMIEYPNYSKAVIVTSDGDFYSLVDFLYKKGKLEAVLSTSPDRCSALLKQAGRERMQFLNTLKGKLQYP